MSINNNHCPHSFPIDSPSNKNKELLSEYNIIKIIGKGSFSIVKLGENKLTKEKVAIKIMQKNKIINQDDLIRIDREMQMLKSLNHENVIKIYKILEDSKRFYIIMEYCENGELFSRIIAKKRLTESEAAIFYYQLINGLEYIHKNNIIHRDLKPENLLLSKDDILKIIDFGLSNYSRYDILLDTPCGSPNYAAPEMVSGQKYNGFLTDIWSTGIILYAMICGYLPFEDNNNESLFEKIFFCKINYPKHIGKLPLDLLERIIVSEPYKRITLEQIKQHPFYLKGKFLFNQKYEIKKSLNKKISVKNITKSNKYKMLKNILNNRYKLKGNLNNHTKNIDNDLLNYKTCTFENQDSILYKVYKLNETENYGNNKKIEEEKNDKGNNLKDNLNNYKIYKISKSKNKSNYKTPTDSVSKKQKFINVFNFTNSKNNEIKETELNPKKSTKKITKFKKIKKPFIIEVSHKKTDNFGNSYLFNIPKTARNKVRVKKITLQKKNNTLMEKNNHTIDLEDQMHKNSDKIRFIYNNRIYKDMKNQKCGSEPKNRDILIYSLTNKYPHNNHRKKNILNINQTERIIHATDMQKDKYFKDNNNKNFTTININDKRKSKLIQYFNKKHLNSTFDIKKGDGQHISNKLDIFNLSKDKKDKTFEKNNNNIEKYNKFNNYLNKVTSILQNKYNDSKWIDKSIKHKRKINIMKIKKKEPLNIIENITTEKAKEDFKINNESKNTINYILDYCGNTFMNNGSKNISKYNDNIRISENSKININIQDSQREKSNLEDEKNNNECSKYKKNINNTFDFNKNIPKKNHKANVINIKNIKNNMKFYKNSNYIKYNNYINENNKSRKKIDDIIKNNKTEISDKSNKSIFQNDMNNRFFENNKVKNSFQTYDLNNSIKTNNYSLNTNGIYFERNSNKEERVTNFKNSSTNKNYIKRIYIMNNKSSNNINSNNFVNRTCDILNNDSIKRYNLTSKNQNIFNRKINYFNNDNYLFNGKSNFLYGKINNINESQKTYREEVNYNNIINFGNDTFTFPYTNYIENIYPKDNYKKLNTIDANRMHISTIGQKYSNIFNTINIVS